MMKKVRKAIIPVAGLGTRFLPATKAIPKELLPIIDKPTLELILEEVAAAGIEEVLLITRDGKEVIKNHFTKNEILEEIFISEGKNDKLELIRHPENLVKLSYIKQEAPKGSGHAISLGKDFIGDEPFAVLYGDDLMSGKTPILKQLVDLYEATGSNIIGVQEVPLELVSKYGIIKFADGNKIDTIVEKPKQGEHPSLMAGLGRYIVSPKVFDCLDKISAGAGGEYQFTDAMKMLMETEEFRACEIDGTYYDIGSQFGYVRANLEYALKRDDTKEAVTELIKKLYKEL